MEEKRTKIQDTKMWRKMLQVAGNFARTEVPPILLLRKLEFKWSL